MTDRFRREGMGFRFAPDEASLVLHYSRPADHRDETTFEVGVFRRDGARILTRRVNLLANAARGSVKDLTDELATLTNGHQPVNWGLLLREANESVLASHRSGRPVEVIKGEIQRPPPPEWLCRPLLLRNKANCWLGAASTGKSTLAKAICAYYASGFRFCGFEMDQGVPLYLDWEDDREGFERTVYDVCRNLGVWPLPRMLWRDMHGYRLRDQVEMLSTVIDRERVGLVVLDAVAAAGGSPGEHMSWEGVALELEQSLGALPPVTVLGLDHVTGADHAKRGTVPQKARGAERKVEFFRNQWSLVADDEAAALGRHVVVWTHTKINVVAKAPSFATEIVHHEADMSIISLPMADREPPESDSQSAKLLVELGATSGRTARELALQYDGHEPNDSRIKSVRKMLDRAVSDGKAYRLEGTPVRYRCGRQPLDQGVLLTFPREIKNE